MIGSAEEFVRLRTSEDPAEYERAAAEEAAEATWLDVIERFPQMREWVAQNKTIPESVIRRLFAVGDARARLVLAYKRRTPPDLLAALARDADDSVRLAVAHHPKAPADVLAVLAEDPWERVRDVAVKRRG